MKKILIIMLAVVLALSIGLIGCTAPAEQEEEEEEEPEVIELKWADFVPAGIWYYDEVIVPFFDMVEEKSDGRLKITGYPGGSLLEGGDIYNGVKSGIADMGREEDVAVPGIFPMLEVMGLGGVDYNRAAVACWAKAETYKALVVEGVFEELADVHVLHIGTAVPEALISKQPVYQLEDIQGVELLARGKDGRYASALGATAVDLFLPEIYDGLDKGIIQGAFTAPTLLDVFRLADHTNALTFTPFMATTTTPYFVNLDTWNSLPKDLQDIITESAAFFVEYEAETFDFYQIQGITYAEEAVPEWESIYLTPEEEARWIEIVQAEAQEQIAELEAEGLPAQKVYDELIDQVEKYNETYPPLTWD